MVGAERALSLTALGHTRTEQRSNEATEQRVISQAISPNSHAARQQRAGECNSSWRQPHRSKLVRCTTVQFAPRSLIVDSVVVSVQIIVLDATIGTLEELAFASGRSGRAPAPGSLRPASSLYPPRLAWIGLKRSKTYVPDVLSDSGADRLSIENEPGVTALATPLRSDAGPVYLADDGRFYCTHGNSFEIRQMPKPTRKNAPRLLESPIKKQKTTRRRFEIKSCGCKLVLPNRPSFPELPLTSNHELSESSD
eukprot:5462865-Prymnesium_polylepis.1